LIATLRRILSLWRPHRWLALALAVTLVLRTAFTVVLALSIKLIIDRIVEGTDSSPTSIVVVLVAGYAISAGAAIAAGYLEAIAAARILSDVRGAAFDHLQRLSIGYHNRTSSGDILARFSTDVAGLQQGAVKKPRQALQSLLALALFMPVMFALEWRLTLLTVVAMPLAVALAQRISPNAVPALDAEKRLLASVLDEVSENLQAQPVIRAFGLHRRAGRRFRQRLERLQAGSTTANFRVQLLSAISQFAVSFAQLIIVGFGAVLALNGDWAAGDFAAFVALLAEFGWETTVIASDVIPEITRAGSGIRRIDELLSAGPTIVETPDGRLPPDIHRAVQFDDVAFGYTADERQLNEVSLDLPAGANIAVVGASGSGKSTLLNLLLRFYDPDAGRVMIDSVDLRDIDLSAYRSSTGVVFQDTFLFGVSLAENIQVARPEAEPSEVEEAADRAGLTPLIERLPDGINTIVGVGGRRLSGGQRQRIGIARAILRSPPLLLLDEVTSALDPVTEAAVNTTLAQFGEGRTVISVTHRLQSVSGADLVIVMQEGRPVEQGSFDALRGANGPFREMWDKQAGFQISPDGRAGEISVERLRAIPLFAEVEPKLLAALGDSFVGDHFVIGEDIFRQGDPADRFHVIARGVAEVIRQNGEGSEVLAHLEDGDFFGEMAFLDDAPRNATVRAVTPTLTLSLDRTQFNRLMATSPDTAETVRKVAAARAGDDSR